MTSYLSCRVALDHLSSLFNYMQCFEGKNLSSQDELREFGLKDEDVFSRKATHKWREFMKKQIMRARAYFDQAEQDATQLDSDSRWPVCMYMVLLLFVYTDY